MKEKKSMVRIEDFILRKTGASGNEIYRPVVDTSRTGHLLNAVIGEQLRETSVVKDI
jgi:hypothetical protein